MNISTTKDVSIYKENENFWIGVGSCGFDVVKIEIQQLRQIYKDIGKYLDSIRRQDIPNRADICSVLMDGPLSVSDIKDRWDIRLDHAVHTKIMECLSCQLIRLNKDRNLELKEYESII
jgi:hypothetical protein